MGTKARYALRVTADRQYVAADTHAFRELTAKHKAGELVFAEFTKPRNPGFHRLAHSLGALIADNIEAFAGLDPHAVLKRLQIEGNVGCDEIALDFPNVGPCSYRVPRSLAYESMDQDQFHAVIAAMCDYVSRKYWPSLRGDQIAAMADAWVEAA